MKNFAYRPDIDGLRALAILPVVFYHLQVPGFSGGFIGVDVFFVISGYLMASLISAEIGDSRFNVLRFYERRIRRIFPALFTMLAVSCVAAWLLLMPVEFEYFARSLKAASLFSSNIQFERENGYFDMGAQLKPLLHTWSLALEEQFYVLFPLLLLIVARFGQHLKCYVLATILGLSFATSNWVGYETPQEAFYLLQFRAWELLLGALVSEKRNQVRVESATRQGLAALGVCMIAVSIFSYTDKLIYPGFFALLPCAGAALVLFACAEPGIIGQLIGCRPFASIGLISYSLYLWHWPLIVFCKIFVGRELFSFEKLLIFVASFALAVLSWRFIEQPVRGWNSRVGKTLLFSGAALSTICILVFGGIVLGEGGFPNRLSVAGQKVYSATYDVSRFGASPCLMDDDHSGPSIDDIRAGKLCTLGSSSAAPAFLVWGDSHAAAMAPAIDSAASNSDVSGLLAAHSSCPPLPGVELSRSGDTRKCDDFNRAVLDLITNKHISLVFLAAYWPKYVHDAELPNEGVFFDPSVPPPLLDKSQTVADNLDRLMHDLRRQGTKVVLVMDVPEMGYYMPEALAKAMMAGRSLDLAPPWEYVSKRQALSRALLSKAAKKYGDGIIDPLPEFCPNDHCDALRHGMPLYRDADHITATASIALSGLFEPILRSFARSNSAGAIVAPKA